MISGIYPGVTTTELDNLAAETAAYLSTQHPDYSMLAARIAVSNLQKNTKKSFSETMTDLYNYVDAKTGRNASIISEGAYKVICDHAAELDAAVIYDRDFYFDYFGFKVLERSYLLRMHGKTVERPQHMLVNPLSSPRPPPSYPRRCFLVVPCEIEMSLHQRAQMRVSVGIHGDNIPAVLETYNFMSEKWFIHASPTLFNSGTPHDQLSSCFLVAMKDDSIDGIYDTLKHCASISKVRMYHLLLAFRTVPDVLGQSLCAS